MKTNSERIVTFRMSEARYRSLVALSERHHRSVSGSVRLAVERLLDGPAAMDLSRLSDDRSRKIMEG
jgi:predicted DNA-binding protein